MPGMMVWMSHAYHMVSGGTVAVPSQSEIDIGALFDAHAAYLCRVVHRLTGSRQVAVVVVQEVFITAWRRREDLDPNSNVRSWLYRVAVNHVRHQRRSVGRLGAFLDRYTWLRRREQDPETAFERIDRQDKARMIQACVLKLSDKQREVFVLYELEALEGAEVAEVLDLPINTVWSRLRLARKRFRELWNELQETS